MRTLQEVLENEPKNKPIRLLNESYKLLEKGRVSDVKLVKWYLCDVLIVSSSRFDIRVCIHDVVSKKECDRT